MTETCGNVSQGLWFIIDGEDGNPVRATDLECNRPEGHAGDLCTATRKRSIASWPMW